jgi:hypothetical protein
MPFKGINLKDAIALYSQEKGTGTNAYNWYRQYAQSQGSVPLGDVDVEAKKIGGAWQLDERKFQFAIQALRKEQAKIVQNTLDLKKGVVHGKNGDRIEIDGGYYDIHQQFRHVVSNYDAMRHKSDGTWFCNKCNNIAATEHKNDECHVCADWNGCGEDCTLSKVICMNPKCGGAISF